MCTECWLSVTGASCGGADGGGDGEGVGERVGGGNGLEGELGEEATTPTTSHEVYAYPG
jgi:hypothetical protein